MNRLIACAACGRHVHAGEEKCPFCDAVMPAASEPAVAATRGMSRAKLYALQAALATGITAAGCAGSDTPTQTGGDADAFADGTDADTLSESGDGDTTPDAGDGDTKADSADTKGDAPPDFPYPPYGCVFPDGCATVRV